MGGRRASGVIVAAVVVRRLVVQTVLHARPRSPAVGATAPGRRVSRAMRSPRGWIEDAVPGSPPSRYDCVAREGGRRDAQRSGGAAPGDRLHRAARWRSACRSGAPWRWAATAAPSCGRTSMSMTGFYP